MVTSLNSRRLAGIRFEHRVPEAPALLPRMDIALFVGFAAAGPMHTPVPLESVARFRDVFGPDLDLARNPATGVVRRAHLAPSVRAFFANGGRRCWVIRVADERRAEASRVDLPGVLRVKHRPGSDPQLEPALARARSAGASFDRLEVRTSLAVRNVSLTSLRDLGSDRPRLTVKGSPQRALAVGDLVRLRSQRSGHQSLTGFLPIVRSSLDPSGDRVFESSEPVWFMAAGEPTPSASTDVAVTWSDLQAFAPVSGTVQKWPTEAASGTRTQLVLDLVGVANPDSFAGRWLRLEHADGVLWMFVRTAYFHTKSVADAVRIEGEAWWEGSRPAAELLNDDAGWIAEVVSLDMRVLEPDRDPATLIGLGFTPLHRRAWADLLDDDRHFLEESARLRQRKHLVPESSPFALELEPRPDDRRAFWSESDAPRFGVAIDDPHHAHDWFVPLGLDTLGAIGRSRHSGRTALEREGLERFGPELFLDERLAGIGVDALAGEAEALRFGLGAAGAPRALRGLYTAWAIEEASLFAVPDAVHIAWEQGAPSAALPPQASPPVSRPTDVGFDDCSRRIPETPVLRVAQPPDAQGSFSIGWTPGGEPEVFFVLQEAQKPDFTDATTLWIGAAEGAPAGSMERVIRGRAPGSHYYYRVAAVAPFGHSPFRCPAAALDAVRRWWATVEANRASGSAGELACADGGFERSDWSNGELVSITAATEWEEFGVRAYDRSTWLAVSRALARFSCARGDSMALLSLPGHARADDALALQAELLSPSGLSVAIGASGSNLPLGARESAAWAFASLFHPWLTSSEDERPPRTTPPVGAIAGVFAARAIERGAWVAPANQPLKGVIALDPEIAPEHRQDFLDRQLNLLRAEPTGFVILSQDTLAFDPDAPDSPLRPINVRRLLDLLRRFVLRVGEPFVFEPNGENLRVRVRHTFGSVLAHLQARGAFAGRTAADSYRIECGDELNPLYSIESGRLIVQIKVAPSRPLAFLTIRLVQVGERNRVLEVA